MKSNTLLGLIECPYRNGWIEFEYVPGDRISDISATIEAKWGKTKSRDPLPRMYPRSWAFFCEQRDGAYLSLKKDDLIPVEAPTGGSETIEKEGYHFDDGLLDIYFLRRYWEIRGRTPVQPLANYSMKLAFKREYKLPIDKDYAVRLLALVAIVGG